MIALRAAGGAELDDCLRRIASGGVAVGRVALREICGVDTGLVGRWSAVDAHLMPHGGVRLVGRVCQALERAGVVEAVDPDARSEYPEAGSDLEARMLRALARAASPLAVDLLVDQPARWASVDAGAGTGELPGRESALLRRLIDPPLVVAVGPPNVGKSSLLNALARREVSIVADEPGTTRDHVGVLLDLGGLVVRYVDTPGLRGAPGGTGALESEAVRIALEVAARADLLLRCGDATAAPPDILALGIPPRTAPGDDTIVVATRADLGTPGWASHSLRAATVSARLGTGLVELVARIRDALIPPALLADQRAWRFWEAGPSEPREGRGRDGPGA